MNRSNLWVNVFVSAVFALVFSLGSPMLALASTAGMEVSGIATASSKSGATILDETAIMDRLKNGMADIKREMVEMEDEVAREVMSKNGKSPVTVVFEETFTVDNAAAGWYAWKRQSVDYHKANPWEKVLANNCAREPRICSRTAPPNTKFYLPATNVRVLVAPSIIIPKAIALEETNEPRVLKLDPEKAVMSDTSDGSNTLTGVISFYESWIMTLDEEIVALREEQSKDNLIIAGLAVLLFVAILLLGNAYDKRKKDKKYVQRIRAINNKLHSSLNRAKEQAKWNANHTARFKLELPNGVTHVTYGNVIVLDAEGDDGFGEMLLRAPWNNRLMTPSEVYTEIANAKAAGITLAGLVFSGSPNKPVNSGGFD